MRHIMVHFGCAYMFDGCTNLEKAPALPAISLKSNCYEGMFLNCTSLQTPPELPATTLATGCYIGMFYNCVALTGITLPATDLATSCYEDLFGQNRNLKYIDVNFTSWGIDNFEYTKDWVRDLFLEYIGDCEFHKLAELPEIFGDNNIPNGWTVINKDEV